MLQTWWQVSIPLGALELSMLSEPLHIPFLCRSDGQRGVLELHSKLEEDGSASLHISPNDTLSLQPKYAGSDLFDCLTRLRMDVEGHDVFLLCQGARVDVYPSRMMREITRGAVAYRMTLGKDAAIEDLVDIFEVITDENFGTVAEQQHYWRTWMGLEHFPEAES